MSAPVHGEAAFGTTEPSKSVSARLNELLSAPGLEALGPSAAAKFADYCALLLRWNARTNLTAIRDEEGILSRHFVESIACAHALPVGIATLLDFGSGAGFPGIPIAICRPEIAVTLAESQGKKAAFLREAVRTINLPIQIHSGRAEMLSTKFECVTLRAVDRMSQAVKDASCLVQRGGLLAVMTTETELQQLDSKELNWENPIPIPGSDHRILALARVGSDFESAP
jgi:16S rRNA (guanine527-N7)-methyltransferase